MTAVANRIAIKGKPEPCDTGLTSGVDDLEETVQLVFIDTSDPAASIYQARDCDSPRLIHIIVLDQDASAGNTYPIEAFAGFYIAGCREDVLPAAQYSDLDRDCGDPTNNVVYGEFVNLIVEDSGVGEPRPSTTLFSIALAE